MRILTQTHLINPLTAIIFVALVSSTANADTKDKTHNKDHTVAYSTKHKEHKTPKVVDKRNKSSKKHKRVKQFNIKEYKAIGIASWYGYESGNKTASGSRFNPKALTAAHRTLPLLSKVKVTNMKNNKSVIVLINDRGPYHGHRLIDLSLASAKAIDMKGLGRVTIETIN